MRILLLFSILTISSALYSQTGPGGVGNATGATSQPINVLWLKSDAGISTSGGFVDSWSDQSGNGNDAAGSGATRPSYLTTDPNFNDLPSITFPSTATSPFYLEIPDNDNLDNTTTLSVIFVMRPTSNVPAGTLGILSKRASAGVEQSYFFDITNAARYRVTIGTGATPNLAGANSSLNQKDIVSFTMNGATKTGHLDGTVNATAPVTANTISNTNSNLFIGSYDLTNNGMEGSLVEVIIYQSQLNAAQRQIIENYLSAKYGSAITGDVFAGDIPGNGEHDFDLAGIGQQGGAQHVSANSRGLILSPANGTLETNVEFLLAAHNGITNAVSVANLGTGVQQRWERTWYMDKTTPNTLDANITFDFSEGIAGQFPQNKDNYVLLKYDGADYQIVAVDNANKTVVGDQLTFSVSDALLTDGIYTLGTIDAAASPVNGVSGRTWYSYQSGDWTDPNSWTLDGGLFPLLVNPSSETPTASDNVVITSGRTIIMNTSNIQVNSMEVIGTLDLGASTGHNFVTIKGSGRIRIAGSTDNFPAGITTEFVDANIGGTVEINGTGMVLGQARTFNNLEINLTTATDLVTLLNNIVLNGRFKIINGTFKFNNDAASANRNLTVYGNVSLETSGAIRVGTTNNRHEFNVYGDFTNEGGTAYFTQRTAAVTGSTATDGIVDFNILSSTKDQIITCNGVTRFYRIEITKGIDDTYKATLTASEPANFNLFGRANYDINEASAALNANGTNLNALGLNTGTVEIGTNVNIPTLNTVVNYAIYQGAQLWVNGGSVTKSAGEAIVPYGKVRVSSGSLTASVTSGLTLRESGIIQVDGGTLTARSIRTSVTGANAVGSYIQSGGTVTLTGGSVNAGYAVFSLTYTGNVFNMSGGVLTVQNRANLGTGSLRGAIFINSDPANTSITGGTVILEANNAIVYRITSRSSFRNVIMRATGAARTFQLLGTISGTGGGVDEPSVAIQPLVVVNDLTIEPNATFTTNSADVTIGGNFEIQNGATYTHGSNTTTINGSGVSSLIFGNTAATQTLNNLTISKSIAAAEAVISTGQASPAVALQVNGTLAVSGGIFNYGNFIVSAKTNVSLASGVSVGIAAATGKLLINGTSAQTLSSTSASIHNMELDNTTGLSLATGDLTILKTLTLTNGVFNISTFKLTLNGAAATIAGSGFGTTKMIQTAGNAGDGGLEMYFDAAETIFYPMGTNANAVTRYTPATVRTVTFTDDGLIRISIEDRRLQLASLTSPHALSYNWRVVNSSFSAAPLVSYQFNYDQTDVDGTEANYIPGRVQTASPFTGAGEANTDIDIISNILTFNGTTTGGTFPGAGSPLVNAAYTAGAPTLFSTSPTVYYNLNPTNRAARNWNDNDIWSLISHTGASTNNAPGPGDIVMLTSFGENNQGGWVNMNVDVEVAAVIFNHVAGGFLPRITVTNGRTVSLGTVSGTGTIMVEVNPALPVLNNTDIGDFANQTLSVFNYKVENDATYDMYPAFTTYPNLRIEGSVAASNNGLRVMRNTTPVIIKRNLTMDWGGTFRAEADVMIGNDLRPGQGGGGGGRFQFGENGSHTVTVTNAIASVNSANNRIEVLNTTPSTRAHTLKVGGDITLTTGLIDLYNGTGTANNAILELNTAVTGSFTNASGNTPDLFRLTMNKGTSITPTFTLSDNVVLNGPFDGVTKPLVLQNGLLIMDDPGLNFTLTSGGSDFNIPGSSGLEVKQGSASTSTTSTSANITLDGLLRVSGGTVNVDGGASASNTNYIEYSNSGNAAIEVTSGSLTVAGQIRRGLTTATGVLKYTQSGGTVLVANESATSTTRGAFEVLNTGSQFIHTGGSFTIVRGTNSATIPSLWLEPASATVTGSTIILGNGSTPASQNFGIQSTVNLNNLNLAGSNNPVYKIYTTPLTVGGNLVVSLANTLNANSQNLTIGGNFTVDGSYVPSSNITTFNNTAAATISGATSLLNFYDFTKSGSGTLTLSKDITINHDLVLSAGTFATGSQTVTLKGNATIDATHSSTSGSGIVFSGSSQQQLKRTAAGTGTLGIITVNNSSGVIIPEGNGYNFDITTGLRLSQGVFDIGGSLIFLRSTATITPVNPFSVNNMIQTNSSFTDKGVKKEFPRNYTTDFVFPVGQLNYTPVTFNFSTPGNTTGNSGTPTITVRPANERHPSIINDDGAGELPDPVTFNDLNNVLQYHWIVNADNVVSTFKSSMTLSYPQSLVSVVAPYTEADYIAARILTDNNPTKLINKFTTAEVDETLNTITINFEDVTDAGISAEYFAGVDKAIPDNIAIYTTTGSGNANAAIYTPVVPGGGTPRGAVVIVSPGHTLTLNTASGSVSFYETQISAGALLSIPTGSIGHRLGTITGTGDLRIDSNTPSAVMPAAVYDDFFSCAGGGLIFGGSGSYEILGGITALKDLTLLGSNIKTLGNNDVTICNDVVINGPTFNTNSRVLTIQNDFRLISGTYNNTSSTGTLNITRDLTMTAGTFNGGSEGTKTIGRNLVVNGGTLTPGSGTTNIIRVNGNMTVNDAATITAGTAGATGQKFTFGGTTQQTLTGNFTGTRAFNRLEIDNTTGLVLAGNTTINSELLLTNGNIAPNANTFLLAAAAVANPTSGRETSFVSGKLYKVLSNGQSFIFPIGKGVMWRSGQVLSVSQAGSVTWDMEYIQGSAIGAIANAPAPRNTPVSNLISADPLILTIANGEYWRVSDGSATSNGRTARVGLSWGTLSDVSVVQSERESLKVMTWNGTDWTNSGGHAFLTGHTQARGTFESASTLSFSENIVTLGSTEAANALPITLISFNGKLKDRFVELTWKTASELNNDYFEVQRSADGLEFMTIAKIDGKGTTNAEQRYSFEDDNLFAGKRYYRLKQVDFDGRSSLSSVILINIKSGWDLGFDIFPNPSLGEDINVIVRGGEGDSSLAQIRIINLQGQEIYKSISDLESSNKFLINAETLNLKKGVYIIEVAVGFHRVAKRLVIN